MLKKVIVVKPWMSPFYLLLSVYFLLLGTVMLLIWNNPSFYIEVLIALMCFFLSSILFLIIYMIFLSNIKYVISEREIKVYIFGKTLDVIEVTACKPRLKRFFVWEDILLQKEYFWFEQGRPSYTALRFLKSRVANTILREICDNIDISTRPSTTRIP